MPVTSVQIAGVSYDNLGEAGLEFLAGDGGRRRAGARAGHAQPGRDGCGELAGVGHPGGFCRQPAARPRRLRPHGRAGHLHLHALPVRQPAPFRRAHRLGREQRGVLRQLRPGGAHQPRRRSERPGGRADRAHPGLRLSPGREPPARRDRARCSASVSGHRTTLARWARSSASSWKRRRQRPVPYIRGVEQASLEELKSFCASLATYGGAALFHMHGHHARSGAVSRRRKSAWSSPRPRSRRPLSAHERRQRRPRWISSAWAARTCRSTRSPAWPSCCKARQVVKEFWITTARPTKHMADRLGYTADHRSQRGQVRRRHLLRGRPDPRALQRPGDRQRQSLLLRLCQEQVQNPLPAVR